MDEINKVFNIVGVEGDSHCLLHSFIIIWFIEYKRI